MPRGGHTGVRVALAVPPGLYEQLSGWADAEGRPVAALAMALIEQGLRDAQANGLIPSPTETLEDYFRARAEAKQKLHELNKNEQARAAEFRQTPDEILEGISSDATPEEKKAALAAILSQLSSEL